MTFENWMTFIICIFISVLVNILCELVKAFRKERNTHVVNHSTSASSMRTPAREPAVRRPIQQTANRSSHIVVRTLDTFPRCPQCRARNRAGEPQKIFWDSAGGRFKCCNNHYFNA